MRQAIEGVRRDYPEITPKVTVFFTLFLSILGEPTRIIVFPSIFVALYIVDDARTVIAIGMSVVLHICLSKQTIDSKILNNLIIHLKLQLDVIEQNTSFNIKCKIDPRGGI